MYGMPHDDAYCYSGVDVLVNKLGIRDAEVLDRVERLITDERTKEMALSFDFGECGFEDWKRIHAHLFGDVYDWAGEVRTIDIYKGYSDFVASSDIESVAEGIFAEKAAKNGLSGLEKGDFCREMAYFLTDIDHLHPFREGNGRSERILATEVARRAGWDLGIERMGKRAWHESMVATRSTTSVLERMLNSVVRRPEGYAERQVAREERTCERTPIVERFSSFLFGHDRGMSL